MKTLVLDIETFSIANADAFLEPVSAPSNYKDEAKIAAYCAERRVELLARCALDPDLCRIVAIGLSDDTGDRVSLVEDEQDEHGTLCEAWGAIQRADILIGFNLLAFDLPVLIRRSQYLGLPVPLLNLDKYRTPHVDLIERLSFNGKIKAHSLDFYCARFGILSDDPHDGADIDALVKAGEWDAIAAHCRSDIAKTKALAERLGYLSPVAQTA